LGKDLGEKKLKLCQRNKGGEESKGKT